MTQAHSAGFRYRELAIADEKNLVFGTAPKPLDCGFDLRIGGGLVFPEVNFTLPAIEVNASTWSDVLGHYREIATGVVRRAVALQVPPE